MAIMYIIDGEEVLAVQGKDLPRRSISGRRLHGVLGATQLLVEVQDVPGPLSLVVPGVNEHHLLRRVADEEVVAPAGMGRRAVVDVHTPDVRFDLHGLPQSDESLAQYTAQGAPVDPRHRGQRRGA